MYNISSVSNMTGVNPITLRAWERRYGLITPARTPKGHRLYSDDDVLLIHRVLDLLKQGIAISQVSRFLEPAKPDTQLSPKKDSTEIQSLADQGIVSLAPWATYQARMLKAVISFDEHLLEDAYNESMSLYPVDLVTKHLLVPLLSTLGDRWNRKMGGVGEEHFFSVFMRNKLGSRFHHRNLNNTGPRILTACLPGELHELGVLLFSLAAHDMNYRITLLGANMPIGELESIARLTNSDAIALSATVLENEADTQQQIKELTNSCDIPIFIGGQIADNHRQLISDADAIPTSQDIGESLNIIHRILSNKLIKQEQ
jgi:DNA-binding transcriptional MerR regulator/methylmalonyl-CoA mutase cobalamin-binding subunit